ncbi:hypothetical protein OA860_00370 [Prochlorococcus sp. AH-716-E13]|nr:hypothetical protein [Prochlorococcus sp. AH-716-E13]
MAKRLTEIQKEEIILGFTEGKTIEALSKEYGCSKLTVVRNLKKNLGDLKYTEILKKDRFLKEDFNSKENDEERINNLKFNIEKSKKEIGKIKESKDKSIKEEFLSENAFLEIPPLDYEIENSERKELSSVHISDVDFPKVVYMVVDKKIELEIKSLKDYPEWQFLPSHDLDRKSIEIYFDLKIAKRFCSKEQKVIKVPNTDVFRIAAPILISRGISRIVSSDKLIAL